jgi:hypothetical protein
LRLIFSSLHAVPENFAAGGVHAIERSNDTNEANRNDARNILISPMLLSASAGFHEEAFLCMMQGKEL